MNSIVRNSLYGDLTKAMSFHQTGQLSEAESLYRNVLEAHPNHPVALRQLGRLAYEIGFYLGSVKLIDRAARIRPDDAETQFYLGSALHAAGLWDRACQACRRTLEIQPDNFPALVNLGNSLIAAGRFEEAVGESRRALKRNPNSAEALSNLGQALSKSGNLSEAVEALKNAAELVPENPEFLNNLGVAQQSVGDLDDAVASYRAALKINPDAGLAERNLLNAVLNKPDMSSDELFDLHRRFGRRHDRRMKPARRVKRSIRKLRIGYLSSDFHAHPVGFNILPLIENHDHDQFEIFLYAHLDRADSVTDRFQNAADRWRIVNDKSDAEIAQTVSADGIDIMVYLAGRFNLNRPTVASHRPAPVQVSYHDCATSGLADMDYWLTDDYLHPENTVEKFTEQLYRLPLFYQYPRPDDFPEPGPLPADRNGYVTFGCFNKPEKISDSVVDLWAKILHQTPCSRLMLKNRTYFDDPMLRQRWRDKFEARGIASDRLDLIGGDDPRGAHLALYHGVDIALDPFPFNGATTTFEALAMGVPVIALEGRHFVDRVAGALLTVIGLADLIGRDGEDYVNIALKFADDTDHLRELRGRLRRNITNSDLCDGHAYCAAVETAFRAMWKN